MNHSDEESDYAGDGNVFRQKNVERPDPVGDHAGTYVFRCTLAEDELYGREACYVNVGIKFRCEEGNHNDERVGYLEGHLLRRPSGDFFEMADALDGELQELACMFCEHNGSASRVQHPELQRHPSGPNVVDFGGFFHISNVELKEEHRGKDLGLLAIHEALIFLGDDWSLCVMIPGALTYGEFWSASSENENSATSVDAVTMERNAHRKVMVHFGRMGFVQAEQSRKRYHAWFLTSQMYFISPRLPSSSGSIPETATERWLSKTDAEARVNIYMPPPPHFVLGLDKELLDATMLALESRHQRKRALRDMQNLIDRGASINRAHAIHRAAANDDDYLSVLSALVRLGGDVNFADENGSRPLHIAAAERKPTTIKFLLESGADTNAVDAEGKNALDVFLADEQNTVDLINAHPSLLRFPPKEIDVIPKWETALALVSHEVKAALTDDWMSPRMKRVLNITAYEECKRFRDERYFRASFWSSEPIPLDECCCPSGINRIDYIPRSVLQRNPEGLYKSFYDGYFICFKVIRDVLENGDTPTLRNIVMQIEHGYYDLQKFEHFMNKGGKVEYALDAVMKISENVLAGTADGWEYLGFQDEIEALPSTPFDNMFDVARFMCIDRVGGNLESCGPYMEVWRVASSNEE